MMLFLAHALSQASEINATTSPAPSAAMQQAGQLREEELLLYSLTLQNLTLSEAITAYGDPANPLLPLGELSRLLDLDISVSPADRRVTGTLGPSRRAIIVDLNLGVTRSGGTSIPLAPADSGVTFSDIYLRASVIERLLQLRLRIDSEALAIALESSEKLPVQERLERLGRHRGGNVGSALSAEPALRLQTPYRLFSLPSFDTVVQAGRDTRTRPAFSARYDVRFAGDLAFANLQGFLSSDGEGKPSAARLLLERRSNEGRLPLGATRLSAGDVFTPGIPIGPRSVSGRGLSFTNIPLEEASVFRTVDLRGELPAGFDVELYVNDVLRSGQASAVQGRYEFLDVPLVRGRNVIRIVVYGLRGERTERVQIVNVGSGQLRQGEFRYDVGAVEGGRDLISLDFGEAAANDVGKRLMGQFSYGLSDRLTLNSAFALQSASEQGRRATASAGIRSSIAGMAVQADGAVDDRKGRALSLGVAGQPFGVGMVLRHGQYAGGFVDETAAPSEGGRSLATHTSLTLDFALPVPLVKTLPLSVRALGNSFSDGSSSWIASARTSMVAAGALVSTGVDYQLERRPGSADFAILNGNTALSKFVDLKWQLRASADYSILPEARINAASFTVDRALSERLSFRTALGHSFSSPRDTFAQAGAVVRTPLGDLSFTGDYSLRQNDWGVGLRLAFGSLFDPSARRYRLTPPGPSTGGNAVFRAFVDRDGDGRFGEGDEPVPQIGIEGGERRRLTGGDGRAIVTGLGTAPTGSMRISLEQVEGPALAPPATRLEYSPRPGQVIEVPYPLRAVGEVYARLMVHRPGEQPTGLAAVQVLLVGEGRDPLPGITEYDGSVVFPDVPLGAYRLQLDSEQSARLGMRIASDAAIRVEADRDAQISVKVEFVRPANDDNATSDRQNP